MKSFRAPRLFKIFMIAAFALMLLASFVRSDEAADLRDALVLAKSDYPAALAKAGPVGSIGYDVIEWQRLRDGKADFAEYMPFVLRRADWPGLPLLRKAGEATIPKDAAPDPVIAYFAGQAPQSAIGALRYADALVAIGQEDAAKAEIVRAWTDFPISADEQAAYLARYASALADHHTKRLDNALWRGATGEAERMLPLVDADWQASATARIALIKGQKDGVTALIKAVPKTLAKGAGLAFDRFRYRDDADNDDGAAELMLERSTSASSLGRPEMWSARRLDFARMWMRNGRTKDAYALASRHYLTEGDDYAELEWLSGYLALKLGDPSRALDHFGLFRRAVATPISLGRAGYWEGRALEAMGAKADALAAYTEGAKFQSSFYGLLAAEKAGVGFDQTLFGKEVVPDWRGAPFLKSSVVQAALLLKAAGERDLSKRFIRHFAESTDASVWAQIAQMYIDLGEPHIALSMAKFAADRGVVLPKFYHPVTALAEQDLVVPTALALAIARRESEFNPEVISSAGARGLMQVMPATAAKMAKKLGVDYDEPALLSDPNYNLSLGAAYLAELIETFGSNYVLVTAGYNAGPNRPIAWMKDRGDPRSGTIDVVDWIEMVPFTETRNYIMRVTESYVVYRRILNGDTSVVNMSGLLTAK